MRIVGRFRQLVIIVLFCAVLGAGYMSVSVMTAKPAAAVCSSGPCLSWGGGLIVVLGITLFVSSTEPYMMGVIGSITGTFTTEILDFVTTIGEKIYDVTTPWTGDLTEGGWWDTFWQYNLRPSFQAMTEQIGTGYADQTRADGSYTDAGDFNRTVLMMDEQNIEAQREVRPSEQVCQGATITGGMARASTFSRAYAAAAPAEQVGRSSNTQGTPSANGAAADLADRWTNTYLARYCSADFNAGNSGCTADAAFEGDDLDVTGNIFDDGEETIDLTDPDTVRTINDMIQNIAEPVVRDPVAVGASQSASGEAEVLKGESYKAKRQVIYDALYFPVAQRAPGSDMQAFINPIREAAGIDPATFSENPSKNEVLHVMMNERYRDGKYGVSQIDEPENNQRELVIQEAFWAMQSNEMLDQMDRMSLIIAAQVGDNVGKNAELRNATEASPLR